MKSERSLRSINSHFKPKHSNSPTLASTHSEKGYWSRSFKNQPFPKELKRRLVGHKLKFSDFSDQEQDGSGVARIQQEEDQVLKKKNILPHYTIMSDRGQFCGSRSRIKSERKAKRDSSKSKSVESLKLPQVMEEKKEQDQLQKLERARVSEVKDKNQFNQMASRHSETNSYTDHHSKDSHQHNIFSTAMPEKIIENEAEETKSEKLKRDKTLLSSEMEKIIVDEVDDKKWKKEESQGQISQIIEEERQEEQPEHVNVLRISLEKLEHENQFLNKFKDEELWVPPQHVETVTTNEVAESNEQQRSQVSKSVSESDPKNIINEE